MKPYADQLAEFCRNVMEGTFPTGRLAKLAVRRHLMDLERGESRGLRYNQAAADKACRFFPNLKHSTGEFAGKPFIQRNFQVFITCNLFGWQAWNEQNGRWYRRFREALLSFAKGNGKTPYAAALANYVTFGEGEPRAEGYCYGTKKDQAKQLFGEACRQARSWPKFAQAVQEYRGNLDGPNGSIFKPMGSETHDDGLLPQFICLDEVHRWQEQHREMYDMLTASLAKRPEPLLMKITTAGNENANILLEEFLQAERVLEQVDDPPEHWDADEQFAYIARLDEEDDIYDESIWAKANPMLLEPEGPVQMAGLRSMASKAKVSISSRNKFKRFHCNQQVSSLSKPIQAADWAKGNTPLPDGLERAPAIVSYDSANVRDFASVAMVWELPEDKVAIRAWAWTVEERVEKLQSAEFLRLLELPNVFVHPGNQIEIRRIWEFITEINNQYTAKAWVYDSFKAKLMAEVLFEDHGINFQPQPQNAKAYSEPLDHFLNAVVSGDVIHGGCPLLKWCAQNLVVKKNADGLQRPDKEKSVNKIDPIVAVLMGWREMLFGEETPLPQVF